MCIIKSNKDSQLPKPGSYIFKLFYLFWVQLFAFHARHIYILNGNLLATNNFQIV